TTSRSRTGKSRARMTGSWGSASKSPLAPSRRWASPTSPNRPNYRNLTVSSRFGTLRCSKARRAGPPMIKSELIQKIAEKNPHLYHRDVERIINTIFDQIINAMKSGDRVKLRGFGAFSVKSRQGRQGRNPRTGDPVTVEPKHVPFFKTGKELREQLN